MKKFFRLLLLIACISKLGFASAQSKNYAIRKVVIDAGHGGHDSGCRGKFSNEKDVALSISLKLGKLIEENFPDVKVIYTRKTDVFITLNDRAAIANNNKADIFLCIHCNAGSKVADGTETYVMGLHKSDDNLRVSQRENASILLEDDYKSKYEGFDPNSPETYIALSLYQNAYLDQSLNIAAKIEKQYVSNGRPDRGVKQAGFWVLYRTTMPSILTETGFLTNPEEEKYLNSEKGQNETAGGIFKAFKEYKLETDDKNAFRDTQDKTKIEVKKQEEPDKSDTTFAAKNLFFSVQIGTATEKKPLDLKKGKFKDLTNINTEKNSDGSLKYTVGSTPTYDEALKLQNELKEKGFDKTFVVAFRNGERIPVKEAKELIKNNKVN